MKTKVLSLDSKASGEIDLNDAIFGLEPRADLIQRVVVWQLAKRRAGLVKLPQPHPPEVVADKERLPRRPAHQQKNRHRQDPQRKPSASP